MSRWFRLAAAVVAMIMISNLQYGWTLFVNPMMAATGWKLDEVQYGFSIFIAVMTWAMPFAGPFIDRIGPRWFMTLAGVLCAVGWSSLGAVHSISQFYLLFAVAGLGNCFVYCCSTALGLKWFPDKRGVASGLIAAGYGSGAALFNYGFASLIKSMGYQSTFLYSGIALGLVIVIAGQFLEYPAEGAVPVPMMALKSPVRRQTESFQPGEMLRTPQFYVLWLMMLAIGIGGLMATAQVAQVAKSFGIGATALAISLTLNPLANGAARLGWGIVSDKLGRERTMAMAFGLQAIFLATLTTAGKMGDVWFVANMALVFLTWGELYVLFPTVATDFFGARYAASNYSFLYATKGVAAFLAGGLAAQLFRKTGSWDIAFYGSAALAALSAVAALGLLKMPLPRKSAVLAAAPEPVTEAR
jgi:MFS transporter, OFA family, oxalate/formate antiporter